MKQEIKSICHLYKYAWVFALVSLLCWSMESHAFDYDDNIGFMKEVPANLKVAYPTCDAFLDVQWSRANPNPYATQKRVGHPPPEGIPRVRYKIGAPIWVGKTLIDVYEEGHKQRRGLIVLMNSARETSYEGIRLYPYVLPLDEYEKVAKDEPSQVFVQGDKEDNTRGEVLGAITLGKGDEVTWISERLIDVHYFSFKKDAYYPAHSLAHLTKNICYVSPEGDKGWLFEPSEPFATDTLLSADQSKHLQELLWLYTRDCPALALQANLPLATPQRACPEKALVEPLIRSGSPRDADGDGLSDYIFRGGEGLNIIYFQNDTRPFIMLYPEECLLPSNYYDSNNKRIKDVEQLKTEQQCIAKAKAKYQRQSSSKNEPGELILPVLSGHPVKLF